MKGMYFNHTEIRAVTETYYDAIVGQDEPGAQVYVWSHRNCTSRLLYFKGAKYVRKYNELKRKVLHTLADGRPVAVPSLAVRIGYFLVRGLYPYVARLRRWGLVTSWRGVSGLLFYRITKRGRERLTWLERQGVRR